MSLCLFTEADLRAGRVTHEVALHPQASGLAGIVAGRLWAAVLLTASGTCSAAAIPAGLVLSMQRISQPPSPSFWTVVSSVAGHLPIAALQFTMPCALAPLRAEQDNKTGDVWHVALPRLDPSLLYAYRVFGANEEVHEESEGQRHDPVSGTQESECPQRVLLLPWRQP